MNVSSPAFDHNQPIPPRFTCDGENISPPLEFSEVPDKAKSLALVMDDPDAPGGTFVHWLVWNISPELFSRPTLLVSASPGVWT
jgi:Raf kinase inhibitor-like YbhB/YbcL family protein